MKRYVMIYLIIGLSFIVSISCSTKDVETCPQVSYGTPNPVAAPLLTDGGYFKDTQGRAVILRGVNVAGNSKVPPFTPITRGDMLDPLPAWGLNTIRLLFTWEAFEGTRCSHDENYLRYYEQVVEWAQDRGIYVIVDFHQDAFSRYSVDGCGNGFPAWAVTPEVDLKTPDNSEACSSWSLMMIVDPSFHKTWSHFHSNKYGALDRYLDMVEAVAERMSKHANVIGYELINEPWGTDAELFQLFEKIGARIRGRHPNTILFVPPHCLLSGGNLENNIAKPTFGNFAYSPHFYGDDVFTLEVWLGIDWSAAMAGMRTKAETWQVPMVLSEFGASSDVVNIVGYMESQYDWLDKYLISSMQWCYTPTWSSALKDGWNMENMSISDDSGQLKDNFTPRPYPQKIAGTPVRFERSDSGFTLSWNNNPRTGNTEVFLPADYADDKTLNLVLPSGVTGSCDILSQLLVCTVNGSGNVQVTLSESGQW